MKSMTTDEAAEYGRTIRDARALLDSVGSRNLTADEQQTYDEYMDRLNELAGYNRSEQRELEALEAAEAASGASAPKSRSGRSGVTVYTPTEDGGHTRTELPKGWKPGMPIPQTASASGWVDQYGRSVPCLRANERLADYGPREFNGVPVADFHLGRAVQAMITGDWGKAPAERSALSTTNNTAGGYLVPNPLSSYLIDLARANTVLVKAGAQVIPMESADLRIARVSQDPTHQVKGENDLFTGSDVAFDSLTLVAHTIGTTVRLSRELASDAPNAASLIQDVLAKSLAAEIDRLGLMGDGGKEPHGLTSLNITKDEAVGAITDYAEFVGAWQSILEANGMPTAYIVTPREAATLELLTESTTEAYMRPPACIRELQRLITTQIPTVSGETKAFVGDFGAFLIGLRQNIMIETSLDADEAFDRHSVAVKVVWRGDFAVERGNWFVELDGITVGG